MSAEKTRPDLHLSKEYLRVYSLLINAAEMRGLVTYSRIADILGLPHQGNNTGKVVGEMLGAITQHERAAGRPMLSSVAVSSTNWKPGQGFAGLAETNGDLSPGASNDERLAFWESELTKVYKVWSS